ncbi:hypothetical protein Lal_00001265 [Lupinus albus]|nr:hypothetical protein Lal_00001265 [Lupinus albus]
MQQDSSASSDPLKTWKRWRLLRFGVELGRKWRQWRRRKVAKPMKKRELRGMILRKEGKAETDISKNQSINYITA